MVPPIQIPLRREAANLSRIRSPAISRSNWANDSNTLNQLDPEAKALSRPPRTRETRASIDEIELEKPVVRFTRRVRHGRLARSKIVLFPISESLRSG